MKCGMGNEMTSFKKRRIKFKKPVFVYRNLNCKGVSFSIKQDGLVVAHASKLLLRDVSFKVSEAGRKRTLKEKRRNVHAFAVGTICMKGGLGLTAQQCEDLNYNLPAKIKYNPHKHSGFTCENLTTKPFIVNGAMFVCFNKHGVFAAYTS